MIKWKHNFNRHFLQRGYTIYEAGGVLTVEAHLTDDQITAIVAGTSAPEYQVIITLSPDDDNRIDVYSHCDCPVKTQCKHAAAVMFSVQSKIKASTLSFSTYLDEYDEEPYTSWISSVVDAGNKTPDKPKTTDLPANKSLVYVLKMTDTPKGQLVSVSFHAVIILEKDEWKASQPAPGLFSTLMTQNYVTDKDKALLTDLMVVHQHHDFSSIPLPADKAPEWLQQVVHTERCCWMSPACDNRLSLGESRKAEFSWALLPSGSQRPSLKIQNGGMTIPTIPPYYVDTDKMCLGLITSSYSPAQMQLWLNGPAVSPHIIQTVRKRLKEVSSTITPVPLPRNIEIKTASDLTNTCLTLRTYKEDDLETNFFALNNNATIHALQIEHYYGDTPIDPLSTNGHTSVLTGNSLVNIERDSVKEYDTQSLLWSMGFIRINKVHHWVADHEKIANWLTLEDEMAWLNFISHHVPKLEDHGITVQYDPSFKLSVIEADSWFVDLEEHPSGIDWFSASVGVVVNNKKVDLIPILAQAIARIPANSLNKALDKDMLIELPGGHKVRMPAERLRLLSSLIIDLFSRETTSQNKPMEVPWLRAMELARLNDSDSKWICTAPQELASRLKQFSQLPDVPPVAVPAGLNAELRDYQKKGLSWLQFLREHGFGAVLADDMGLGKTIQALAHILTEKQAGRLIRPCLIVAPTSVLYNWEDEATRFSPELRVHVSHGPERKAFFDALDEWDVVITSYALLIRDGKHLLEHSFHFVILDEAQNVRNHKTKASRTARLLDANQKIALTGTPLENNLDELWSLFAFAVPGLLGEQATFRRMFRTPIEKMQNDSVRRTLARRFAPFLLRRTKDEVATELPPKTVVVQHIELTDNQKDLYETVRASMEKKVRDAISARGMAKSHIIFLDALLKMRQVCCHPKLLNLPAAKNVKDSAKLTALCDMIGEMVGQGRRILIFSQFVSMIRLIEPQLNEMNISYVKIIGQTKDRKTPVKKFQAGDTPVFLISLKAGGTGLNLTAADTVIHFDPWWNPAAENQATDRAHRIGQDKPVFVYKLIAAGTIEEKILELQNRKSTLINGLLDDQKEIIGKWVESDIDALFSPLTGTTKSNAL